MSPSLKDFQSKPENQKYCEKNLRICLYPLAKNVTEVFGLVFFIFSIKRRIFSYVRKPRSTEISSEVYRYYLLFPKYLLPDTGEYVSLSDSATELLIFH